jgi:hypothetical protein
MACIPICYCIFFTGEGRGSYLNVKISCLFVSLSALLLSGDYIFAKYRSPTLSSRMIASGAWNSNWATCFATNVFLCYRCSAPEYWSDLGNSHPSLPLKNFLINKEPSWCNTPMYYVPYLTCFIFVVFIFSLYFAFFIAFFWLTIWSHIVWSGIRYGSWYRNIVCLFFLLV